MRETGKHLLVFRDAHDRLRKVRKETNVFMIRLASDAIDQYVDRYEADKATKAKATPEVPV